jgi:uncharacterized lipoprotein YmbA
MDHRAATRPLLVLAVCIGVAGCAVADPTKFYALGQPVATGGESRVSASIASTSPPNSADSASAVSIGVGPVTTPGYLRRSQIVTRTGDDQMDIAMFHRWAEPLEDGIARVLAEEIGVRVPTDRIVTYPWRGVVARTLQYQVVVVVMRLDGRRGGDVTLDTRWRILSKDGNELAFRRSTMSETAAGPGYEPMIAAMTRALVALGQEIATEIRTLPTAR